MTTSPLRRKLALAGVLAAAAIGSAAPAQADTATIAASDCDARVAALEVQFYDMADRRSYEAAADWWDQRWHAVYTSCISKELRP